MSRSDRPLIARLAQGEDASRVTAIEVVAGVISLAWLVAAGALLLRDDASGVPVLPLVWALPIIAVPLMGIWAIAIALRVIRNLKEERAELQLTLESLRQAQTQAQSAPRPAAKRPEEPQQEPSAPLRSAAAPMAPPPRPTAADPGLATGAQTEQSDLGLGSPQEDGQPPIAIDEFIRALNFPDGPDDVEGIRCLRRALADREAARLIRSAQDVLTLLSQDGIFMDDLVPDRAKPEIWRRFAAGERGRSIAALGGIRDRSSIALTTGRMRSDAVFRDAAHHFLRQFDRSFQAFEKHAEDQDIIEMSNSRTARAFMLLGRVTGVFD